MECKPRHNTVDVPALFWACLLYTSVKLELMSRFHNRNFELLEPYDAKVSRTVLSCLLYTSVIRSTPENAENDVQVFLTSESEPYDVVLYDLPGTRCV